MDGQDGRLVGSGDRIQGQPQVLRDIFQAALLVMHVGQDNLLQVTVYFMDYTRSEVSRICEAQPW